MGKIEPNLNWTGPLDGIMYYMEGGKQLFKSPRNTPNAKNRDIADYIGMPQRSVDPHVLASSVIEALRDEIKDLATDHLHERLSGLFEKIKNRYGGRDQLLTTGLLSPRASDEFENFQFCEPLDGVPELHAVTMRKMGITFYPLPPVLDGHRLILLQIDLSTGVYYKFTRILPHPEAPHPFIIKWQLLKKGVYYPFAFIAGPGFINGVMLRTP
ncbi:MAG: hypothetical protein K0M63_09535 [Weeksellaceae bacterium]|nr:hypothetical protein [Weeksellaceae bacterium]